MTVRKTSGAPFSWVSFLSVTIALLAFSCSALGQSDSTPKFDFFAGYQWLHPGATVPAPFGDPNNPTPFHVPDMSPGFGTAFTYNFDPHWGAEFDLGHNWGNSNYETTVSAGPRFMWRTEGANFFLHALVSYNRLSVNGLGDPRNGIGGVLGGGWDLPFNKTFAWRILEADFVFAPHNFADLVAPAFPNLRRPTLEGGRLRTGVVFSWGGAPALTPSASCSVQPTEVMVGEPVTATVTANNFNPKHTPTYAWSGNGGQVTGKETTATIDTNNVAPGNYAVTVHVTDPKAKTNNTASCTANYTVKPLPPKNPPTMSLSATPTELTPGGTVTLSANCTSPDGAQVSVANWTSTAGTVTGSGNSATLNTAGLPPGPVTVSATCTDARNLTGQASTQVTIQNPPPPPVDKALEARLALHSVYFPTAQPTPKDPNAGLLPSQQRTLLSLATDFKKYLQAKPDARITLEGHADQRGTPEFNQALTERRVARVKSFLVENGVPESAIDTKALGKEHNLTTDEVKQSINQNPDLTTEERKRALARITVIRMASNRRVDITLNSAGQTETSVRQFPFNSTDALSLIGGRETVKKAPAKPSTRKKKPVKKP
ncbi:MAG TPA: OmpA family protein [Candidatus Sulfotelmatobacter sp.]|nr:OmpA family protein [Candidatus Sulfotelmatobacter sp.]